jgi:YHS domain-containing protein
MIKPILILFLALLSLATYGQKLVDRKAQFNLEKGVAIQGYDVVAYFKQGKALKGKKDFVAIYSGLVYQFSSLANKELFVKNAAYYEPQYGGWCAYAMGDSGEKVEINPETFKVIDGKLYLFYNAYFMNTLKSWNKEEAILKSKADANWAKFLSK